MAAVALLVTNVGLVQLAAVQPAHAAVVSSLVFSENFDGVAPPALPAGWTAIRADGRNSDQTWRTSTPGFTTAPNKASVGSYGHVTDMILESPAFVAGAATKLRFYKQGIMQATTGQFSGDNLDGVVLEIKIGTAGYVDFLAAGGTFNAGEGYSRRIASTQDNPLGGRMGWSGHQLGSSVTNATFPTSATGQTVRLRWRLGTSRHTANQGGTNFFQDQAFALDSVEVFSDKTTQNISFTSTAPFRPQVWTTYTPTATASSGLPVTFSIAPGSTCSIAAGVVTFETPGICDIQADQAGNASFAAAPRATQGTFAVKADQIMSFTSTAPENPQVGTTYTPTATTSSGGPITISIAAGSSSVCSIGAANLVTFNATGSCVIQADQAGNANLNPAKVTQTVTVVAAPLPSQTISFTSTAPSSPQAFTTYTPTATASSGLPVTFSIAAGSVCSLAAGVVTFETPGPCTIQADQAGNASFAAAPRVTQSMTVVKADQTVSFTSSAPENPQVGTTYTPTAGASSGGPITFSIASGSSAVCSLGAANLVTFNAAGSCVIQADQVGNANLNPAPQVTQSVNVAAASLASQTISFTSTAPSNPQVGASYTPAATASSGLPVTFSIASGSSSVCSLGAANLVTFSAAGSCVIQADQAGNASFNAAPQVTQPVNVVKANQTISFTSAAPVNPPVGGTYTPAATATSGLPVSFSIASGSSSVCSLGAANLVTFNATGSCVIQADQGGNASFAAAAQVTQTVNVVAAPLANQTISFISTAPINPPVGTTYTPAATATSGLPVAFSIASGSNSVCSLGAANLVTFNATGSCVIQADQGGNASFAAAPQVPQTVTVVKVLQTVSFTSTAPVNPPVGATYTPGATASSGLPVTFSIASGSNSVCSLGAANLVTFNATGSCVIQADQSGNASYNAAPHVTQSVTVDKANQTINFAHPGSRTAADAPFTVSATASSGLMVSFSVPSGGPCTVSGTTVTILAVGTCSITAAQAGDGNYNAAPAVSHNVTITKASPTISGLASAGGPIGTSVHDVATVAGGASPTGTVTFRLFADNACTTQAFTSTNDLVGATATSGSFPLAAPGTYYWTAAYNGDANNNPATSACNAPNQSVTITKASPVMSTHASAGGLLGAPVRDVATLSGGSNPTGTVTFHLFSDNTCSTQVFTSSNGLSGLTATSNWFTPAAAGTYWWTALYNGDANNNTTASACQTPNQSVVITPFQAPATTRTVTGDLLGPLTVNAGDSVVITGGRVAGPVTVNPGGALTVVNSTITRGIVVDAPGFFSLCGSNVSGPSPATALSVSNASVPIRVGDPATGCARNRFAGQVSLTKNLAATFGANEVSQNATVDTNGPGNTVVKANTIFGTLGCTGNTPGPTNDGQPNTAETKGGQCANL